MARRPRPLAPGLLYHVIVRGNHRQKTFLAGRDYHAYLERLATYRKRDGLLCYAYCLMPNHVHLLVETTSEPLAKFMQGLQQSYTQYFNRTHRKVGHLFQGRYQAIVCEKERYLLALVRYIHLNPVRARLVRRPEEYAYSGHRTYLMGKATDVLDPRLVLRLLGGRAAYQRLVWTERTHGHQAEYYQVDDQRFLGTQQFGERMRAAVEGTPQRPAKKSMKVVLNTFANQLRIARDVLTGPDRSWAVSRGRALVAYTLVRRLGYRVSEVAAALGRDVASVSLLISRFASRRQERQSSQDVERLMKIV